MGVYLSHCISCVIGAQRPLYRGLLRSLYLIYVFFEGTISLNEPRRYGNGEERI